MALSILQPNQDAAPKLIHNLSVARAKSRAIALALQRTQGEGCSVLGAIPVFVVDFEDAKQANFLSRARQLSWLYLICSNEHMAEPPETQKPPEPLASVELEAEGSLDLLKITVDGPSIASTLAAYQTAESLFLNTPEKYELKILRISFIRISVLWLHREKGEGKFIPIAPNFHSLDPQIQIPEEDFVPKVTSIAKKVVLERRGR